MAWRPTRFLIYGELDNTQPGKVSGWLQFAGKEEKVILDLAGDFHRDIRGAKICLYGDATGKESQAKYFMQSFANLQKGKAGDITAGLPPHDYVKRPYIEWYSEQNGRVVLEFEPDQIKIIGKPIPFEQCKPISRKEQAENMAEFLFEIAKKYGKRK